MSEQNVPQHWKHETCATGSSGSSPISSTSSSGTTASASAAATTTTTTGGGGCNYFAKSDIIAAVPLSLSTTTTTAVAAVTTIINNRIIDSTPSTTSSYSLTSNSVVGVVGQSLSDNNMFNQQHHQHQLQHNTIVAHLNHHQPHQQQQQQQQQQLQPNQHLQSPSSSPLEFRVAKIQNFAKLSGFDTLNQQIPEDEKLRKVQQIVEAGISDHAKQQILQILDKISLLKPSERLLLYLRMPGGTPETDPLRQPQNPLGTRSEINHTINWVRSHLEHDPKVSIPKQDVYNDYIAYCDRVDIKPLSTADFGKVMKQVFPEIRPRRLGTRGHSRYCYAAMRKATKLDPPKLPDIGLNANMADFNGVMDEDSWKIIKMWAEGLLNSSFDTLKDLAGHITKHHLNTPASNSSRLLLQKKLLQREAKEKRKFTDNGTLKKRRKKKRRSSSSSESAQQQQQQQHGVSVDGTLITVKSENEGKDNTQQPHSTQQVQQPQRSALSQQQQQQMMPINLVTDPDNNNSSKIQGTNSGCDINLVVGCTTTKNPNAQNMTAVCAIPLNKDSSKLVTTMSQNLSKIHQSSGVIIKEELPDDYNNQSVLCKKVRQAHQAKGIWNLQVSGTSMESRPLLPGAISEQQQGTIHNFSNLPPNTVNMMGPPAQIDINQDFGSSGLKRSILNSGNKMPSSIVLRAKKLRYLQAKNESIQEDDGTDKDVLPDNLGIPRERVISICNMDRHELDDYLNGEDNSQDQEAELLQYFQPKDNENAHGKLNENSLKGSAGMLDPSGSGFPVLDNYQLENNSKSNKKSMARKEQDDITQLRYYLHQNLQSNKDSGDGQHVNKTLDSSNSYSGMYLSGSASASLAMMSQRHLTGVGEDGSSNLRCCNPNENPTMPTNNSALRGPRRKINLNARSCVPNSPNTRRKNFSFVPISPNTHHGVGGSMDYSPFVSPRSTPVRTKPSLHKQHSLPLSDQNVADPMIGANGGPYNKMNNLTTISASAPPSPSLVQQRFQFTPASSSSSITSLNNCSEQFNQFQTVGIQCRGQNVSGCNIDGLGERSQSVPLHCRSPAFSQSGNYPGFSSACSSVAQTPVPPEFADFSDPSTILDIFSDTNQSVKLEANEIGSSLLDVDLTSSESAIGISDLLPHDFDTKCSGPSCNSIMSRSVPSTPLPFHMKNNNNNKGPGGNSCGNQELNNISKMYDISKSVPNTPIAMNITPFRYSPDFHRDFLINGNTVEPSSVNTATANDNSGISSYFNQQQQTQQQQPNPVSTTSTTNDSTNDKIISTSITEGIDELSNFGDVTESIMGSDLLNNL